MPRAAALVSLLALATLLLTPGCTTTNERVAGLEQQNQMLVMEMRDLNTKMATQTRELQTTRDQLARHQTLLRNAEAQNKLMRDELERRGTRTGALDAQAAKIVAAEEAAKAAQARVLEIEEKIAAANQDRNAAAARVRELEEQLEQMHGAPQPTEPAPVSPPANAPARTPEVVPPAPTTPPANQPDKPAPPVRTEPPAMRLPPPTPATQPAEEPQDEEK